MVEHAQIAPRRTSIYAVEKEHGDFSAQFFPQDKDEARTDFSVYLNVMRRRKWFIIAPLLIVLPLVIIGLLLQKPIYEATATLLIDSGSSKIVNIEDVLQTDRSREYYETQFKLITSPVLAERVVAILEAQNLTSQYQSQTPSSGAINVVSQFPRKILHLIKEKLTGHTYDRTLNPAEIERHEKIVGFQRSTKVEPVMGTRLVEITISGDHPSLVAIQANALADAYLEQNLEKKSEASRKASAWLTKEIPDLREKLQNAEMALQSFLDSRGLTPADLEGKPSNTSEATGEANTAYAVAKARRIELQAQLGGMEKILQQPAAKIQSSLTALNNPTLIALQQKYSTLEVDLANLSQMFKEKHPKVLAVLAQMEQVRNSINVEMRKSIDSIKTEYNIALVKEKSFENTIAQKRAESVKLSKYIAEYTALKRDVEAKRNLYENLSKRFDETEITKGIQTNDIKIIKRAEKSIEPRSPKNVMKLMITTIVTLIFGVGSSFIAENLEKGFVNIVDAERYLQIPVLGIIPHYQNRKNDIYNLIVLQGPYSEISDCYRNLRTNVNIQLYYRKKESASLLITSAIPGEGKSVTSSNLAISFAQLGKRVLLVDTDLRRPSLHKYFNLKNEFGLTDILIEGYAWDQVVQNAPVEGLKILTSGPIPRNPAELLDMQRMHKLHKSIKDAFDLVIYDAPIVLSVPDTIVIATEADGVLLVHHPTLGNKERVATAKKILERAHANIIGIVFNNVNLKYLASNNIYYESYYHDQNNVTDNIALLPATSLEKDDDTHHPDAEQSSLPLYTSKIRHDNGFSFAVRAALFREELAGMQAGQGLCFLIIDLELNNESDMPVIFNSEFAVLYVNRLNKYGTVLSRMYSLCENEDHTRDLTNMYRCDAVTSMVENGLWGRETISALSKRNGIVVYKVSKVSENYTFFYESEEISININI